MSDFETVREWLDMQSTGVRGDDEARLALSRIERAVEAAKALLHDGAADTPGLYAANLVALREALGALDG